MLIRRIIFALLGTALYLCASAFGDEPINVSVTIGVEATFSMTDPQGATRCVVTTNNGVEFSLVPADPDMPSGIERGLMDTLWNSCGMRIESPTRDQSGIWTIRAFTASSEEEPAATQQFQLEVMEQELEYKEVAVFPSRVISVFPENSMTLRLVNHYENMISCVATSPDGEEFDVLNYVNEPSTDIRPFGQCGVTVRVNESHAGTWRLDSSVKEDEIEKLNYFGEFHVVVRNWSTIDTEQTTTHVERGAAASIRVGPSEAISCQLRDPRGQDLPVQAGNCHVDIPTVTNVHEGLWSAKYSLRGEVNDVEQVMEVVAYDDPKLNATVTSMTNGEINLLCSVRDYSFSFCQFVKPNGQVLNVFEGIGNDRYLYYGQGTQSSSMLTERTHDCGITILKPEHSDIGAWKCILGTSSGVTGSLLTVQVQEKSAYSNGASQVENTVYVVKGNSFTVKCSANVALKYCWMTSPNGTVYSVSSTQSSPTILGYDGMGLSLGECGAVISYAKDSDEGEWRCGMGLSNGLEVISVVPVIVTDTLLFSNPKNVTVRGNQAQLSCSLIPGHEESIDYCRWIRPGGSGIGHWISSDYAQHQYVTRSTKSSCHLDIQFVETRSDIGNWTCIAGLVGSSVEVSDTIRVFIERRNVQNNSGFTSWCVGLGLAMISIIVALVLIAAIRTKFRSKLMPDSPPKYETQFRPPAPTVNRYPQAQP